MQVQFSENPKDIMAMVSRDGEEVRFSAEVQTTDSVEDWLGDLCTAMTTTLSDQLAKASSYHSFKHHCSQILSLRESIRFSKSVASALANNTLREFREQLTKELAEYTASDWSGYRVMQLKVQSLVMDIIHYLDVLNQLIELEVSTEDDWGWHKQLKYDQQVSKRLVYC